MSFRTDDYRAALWPVPPHPANADGQPRRMGIEVEFSGLGMTRIAEIIQAELGGTLDTQSKYEMTLRDVPMGDYRGDFGIELDSVYMKRLGQAKDPDAEVDDLDNLAESVISLIAEQVVPFEVVSPPIPLPEVWRVDSIIQRLREAGARGTRQAPLYAFGLHLNPELPALDAATITAHLQAFLLLFDWLAKRSEVDLSRRITPYIDPFPKAYMRLLLAEDYAPDMASLIDDYLSHNATRNRALDMLPLFAHIDDDRVRSQVDDDRIKARPTFHYRLPNCQIDEPEWGIIRAWRDWLQIEALAADPARLDTLRSAWRKHTGGLTGGLFGDWADISSRHLLSDLL